MTIFISSTCYDLNDLRAEVESFLKSKNHKLLLSERANFPHRTGTHRHDICLENVELCDLFVLVLDRRYGAPYHKDPSISITWAEFRKAVESKRKIIAFVRTNVFNERQSCRHNQKKGHDYSPFYVDDIKTFDLIDEIQSHGDGIWIQPFDSSIQVKEKLENIHETKHSVFNTTPVPFEVSMDKIPVSQVSGSTASYLSNHLNISDSDYLKENELKLAISKIPENMQTIGEFMGSEIDLVNSNDYFFGVPLKITGDEGEAIMGIAPTALGRSIRNELNELLEKIEDFESAITFFTDTVKRKPIICKSCKFNGQSFIVGIYEKASPTLGSTHTLCLLNKFADKWQVLHDESLDEYECFPEISNKSKFIVHNETIYFYFERLVQQIGTMYNGMGTVEFYLFDVENQKLMLIPYEGTYREKGIEGEFNFEEINQNENATLYKFLIEKEASVSNYIYRTSKDYNVDDKENFIEKWGIDNPDFYMLEQGKLNFHLYKESIFYVSEDYGTEDSLMASSNIIENDKYEIRFYFAGPIIARLKVDNSYFTVLVPQGYGAGGTWGLRSIKKVQFSSENIIVAENEYESYKIDLSNGEYERATINE